MARGRPRRGDGRIDAAITKMESYGFTEKLVRKVVKDLLKVYGGTDCWWFLEDGCYEELREACLAANKIEETATASQVQINDNDDDVGAVKKRVGRPPKVNEERINNEVGMVTRGGKRFGLHVHAANKENPSGVVIGESSKKRKAPPKVVEEVAESSKKGKAKVKEVDEGF